MGTGSVARIVLVAGVVWLGGWTPAWAWSLADTVQLQDAGVRFRPLEEIPMLPLTPLDAYRFTMGGKEFEAYDAERLWRHRQTSALCTNDRGRVVVARLDALPPDPAYLINDRFLRAEDFDAACRAPAQWDNETLAAWIAAFTGRVPEGFSTVGGRQAFRYPCRLYRLEGKEGIGGFLMRLPDPPRLIWFEFELAGEADRDREAAVLGSLRSVVAGTIRTTEKRADLELQRMGSGGGSHDEYEATRARVIRNIDALEDWWYVELPHYILVSNLDRQNQRLVKDMQDQLERVRERFVELWEPLEPIRDVSVVRIFNDRDEYLRYVGPENQWTMGVWMPAKRELVISPEYAGSGGRVGREQILNTAYHEAFHQYIFYALGGARIPTWLNEGHACLFESVRFTNRGRSLRIEENDGRLQSLEWARRQGVSVDLSDLMRLDRAAFYVAGDVGPEAQLLRSAHYDTAWSLVYFLRRGAPAAFPGQGYDRIPGRLVDHLVRNPDDDAGALEAALDGIDIEALERDYHAFWDSKRLRGLAKKR